MRHRRSRCPTVWGLLLIAGVAGAQTPATPETATVEVQPLPENAPAATKESKVELQAVYVTARRKKERLEEVPISLAVLDGKALGEAGLTLPTDIQERVPGLVVSVPNARLTSYTIRGLGSSSANDGIESSVGLFLDGVYLGRQGLSIFDLVDLERVEVLRGPQGTLFGKNTTAGAINIVTRAPTRTFEASLDGSAGNFGFRQLRGSLNGALPGEDWSGRLTGYLTRREGLIRNVFDGSDLNARDKYGLRGQLGWAPREGLSGRFIAEFGETAEDCCAYPLVGPVRPAVAERDAYMEYTRPSVNAFDRLADADQPTRTNVRQKALAAEFNWEINPRHKLVSLSAVRDWFFLPQNDDATSLHLAFTSTLNQHRQYSQEFRLDSDFEAFDSTVGLFYIRQDFAGRERVILGDEIGGWVFGGLIRQNVWPDATISNSGPALYAVIPPETLDGTTITTPYTQLSDSLAGFASLSWHLGERLDLTTGLRYTQEWKEAEVSRTRTGGNPGASPLSLTDNLTPLGMLIGQDLSPFTFGGLLDDVAGGDFQRANKRREGNWSGQVALSYKFQPRLIGYASAARGYKSGGINLGVTGESVQPTFKPEQATSFELGLKGRLFKRFGFSSAVYYTDIRDYQALTFDDEQTLLPNPRQTNLLNVGKVRLRGVEFDLQGYLLAGLRGRLGAAYNDAISTEFPNAPDEDTRGNDKDLSGKTLYNAPRWTGTAGLEYIHGSAGGRELVLAWDYSLRSSYYGTVERGRATRIESYDLSNARIGLRGRRLWDVSVWVRNVFDEDYTASVYPLYGVGDYGAFAGDARTYGATLRLNFD